LNKLKKKVKKDEAQDKKLKKKVQNIKKEEK